MDRLLARLERRFGRIAIDNLAAYLTGGMAIVFLLSMARPDFPRLLAFSPRLILHGQVWRLFSYLLIPESTSPLWALVEIYWLWLVVSNLEAHWGAFKLNVYYFVGVFGTTAAAWLVGGAGGFFLSQSLFFAFATLFPEYQLLLFFVLPMQVRWLALLDAAYVVYLFVFGGWAERAAVLVAFGNYLLFFYPTILGLLRGQRTQWRQEARRTEMRASSSPPAAAARSCAICGAREADGADIRVCSCDKCKGATGGTSRTLCLEHARNH